MRDRFEAEVLAMEKEHAGDPDGLRDAAMPIALKIYGADWSVVRAEAKRSLAALPEIDLSAYEAATPFPPRTDLGLMSAQMERFRTPAGLAAARFWDANIAGLAVAGMFSDLLRDGDAASMISMKMSLVPNRVWRGKQGGEDVLAIRYLRSLVIAPYTLTEEGLILPAFERVRVYGLL
jgi:hypothetical protein